MSVYFRMCGNGVLVTHASNPKKAAENFDNNRFKKITSERFLSKYKEEREILESQIEMMKSTILSKIG